MVMELGNGQISDMSTRQNEAHEPLAEASGQKAIDNQLPLVYLTRDGETAGTFAGRHTSFTDLSLTLPDECNARGSGEWLAGLAHRCKRRGLPC